MNESQFPLVIPSMQSPQGLPRHPYTIGLTQLWLAGAAHAATRQSLTLSLLDAQVAGIPTWLTRELQVYLPVFPLLRVTYGGINRTMSVRSRGGPWNDGLSVNSNVGFTGAHASSELAISFDPCTLSFLPVTVMNQGTIDFNPALPLYNTLQVITGVPVTWPNLVYIGAPTGSPLASLFQTIINYKPGVVYAESPFDDLGQGPVLRLSLRPPLLYTGSAQTPIAGASLEGPLTAPPTLSPSEIYFDFGLFGVIPTDEVTPDPPPSNPFAVQLAQPTNDLGANNTFLYFNLYYTHFSGDPLPTIASRTDRTAKNGGTTFLTWLTTQPPLSTMYLSWCPSTILNQLHVNLLLNVNVS